MTKRNFIKAAIAVFIVSAVSTCEMGIPWYGGSSAEVSKIGWKQYLELYLFLLSGPLSALHNPLFVQKISISKLSIDWFIFVGILGLFSYLPVTLAFIFKKYDYFFLFFGLVFWLLSAHLFMIGMYI